VNPAPGSDAAVLRSLMAAVRGGLQPGWLWALLAGAAAALALFNVITDVVVRSVVYGSGVLFIGWQVHECHADKRATTGASAQVTAARMGAKEVTT
jgi:hypothetical protein